MLFAGGRLEVGRAEYASYVALERAFRVFTVRRSNVVWDTRFTRPQKHTSSARRVVYLLLEGWVQWHGGGRLEAPAGFVASQQAIEGLLGTPSLTLAAGGSPFQALQVGVSVSESHAEATALRTIELNAPLMAAARAVADQFPGAPVEAISVLLDRCSDSGLVEPGLAATIVRDEPPQIRRIWDAFSYHYMTMNPAPTLQEMVTASGLSMRQLARDIDECFRTFGFEWRGWRDLTNEYRLRWATLLLSLEEIPVAQVAAAANYSSTAALDRAFREAGLPPPREVRRLVLAAVAPSP